MQNAMPKTPPEPLPIHLSPDEAKLLLLHILPRCHVCTDGHQAGGRPAVRIAYCDTHTIADWWALYGSQDRTDFVANHGLTMIEMTWTFTDLPLASLVRRLQGLVEGQANR